MDKSVDAEMFEATNNLVRALELDTVLPPIVLNTCPIVPNTKPHKRSKKSPSTPNAKEQLVYIAIDVDTLFLSPLSTFLYSFFGRSFGKAFKDGMMKLKPLEVGGSTSNVPNVATMTTTTTTASEMTFQQWSAKVDVSLGCLLPHKDGDQYRYFHSSSNNATLFERPRWCRAKLTWTTFWTH